MTYEALIAPHQADALVKVSAEDIRQIEGVFPLVEARGGDIAALALAAGVPVDVVLKAMADPAIAQRMLASQDKAEDGGELLKPVAARITLAMLNKLREAVAAGELDIDDIGNLMPKVHRIIEHADRMEAARSDGYANLPTFNIIFGVRGRGSISAVAQSQPVAVEMEVFDLGAIVPSAAMLNALTINRDAVEGDEVPAPPLSSDLGVSWARTA